MKKFLVLFFVVISLVAYSQGVRTIFTNGFENYNHFAGLSSQATYTAYPRAWNTNDTHVIMDFEDIPYRNRLNYFIFDRMNSGLDEYTNFLLYGARTGSRVLVARGRFPINNEYFLTQAIRLGVSGNRFSFHIRGVASSARENDYSYKVVLLSDSANATLVNLSDSTEFEVSNNPENNDWQIVEVEIPARYNSQNVRLGVYIFTNGYVMLFDDFSVTTGNPVTTSLKNTRVKDNFEVSMTKNGVLTVSNLSEGFQNLVKLDIYDVSGAIKCSLNTNISNPIKILNLSKGIYIVQMTSMQGKKISRKLIVQ